MSAFGSNRPLSEPRPAGSTTTFERPTIAGPEADDEFRAGIVVLAGPASSEPLSATLAELIASWFAPVTGGQGGPLLGVLDGHVVQVTSATVRDLMRRTDLGQQIGLVPTAADVDTALTLVARHARGEAERRTVADDARSDQARAELAVELERAEQRAALLRELAELDEPVADARPVPSPSRRSWLKR
ncbi:hypothetical protein [Umezawaea sp. Da 62-37]|uniref:hypothetical protein n=1 Tax=Umezawaea sp. Da 62-37 TaxID=3075927 RepID=UPI0028F6E18D|nr:hypothetical protein [Umezawaea sp. Da 62-37]WNV83720.1 hypothetical protein RM788_36890 [Umezawaea sp. Da 62-37]